MNLVLAAFALVFSIPLLVAIALFVCLDSRGPCLFRQKRIGLDRRGGGVSPDSHGEKRKENLGGKPFFIYKIRTMKKHAEHDTGPVWAAPDDPRTTRVGRWLRCYRLDELPQMLNVLKGEMAIVGPRPERPHMVRSLNRRLENYSRRHTVLPGITGWAQVYRGYDSCFGDVGEKLALDLEYIDNKSLAMDIRIMLKTLPVMLRGRAHSHSLAPAVRRIARQELP